MTFIESQPKYRPSYWLLCDNSFPLGQDLALINDFKAYLKHALLFHRELIISDALVINTPNLRHMLQEDVGLRKYLQDSGIKIARRRENGKLKGLVDLKNYFKDSRDVVNAGFRGHFSMFNEESDLKDLEEYPYISFEANEEDRYFTKSIRNIVNVPSFKKNMGSHFGRIEAAIIKATDGDRVIDHRFLDDKLPDSLGKIVGSHCWAEVQEFIKPYVLAYYHNTIPYLVQADIVFSKEHEAVRSVLRNTSLGRTSLARIDLSRGGNSMYESVITDLSAVKLKSIRDSDHFKSFQKSLEKLRLFDSAESNGLEQAIEDVYASLRLYHNSLDESLSIIKYLNKSSAMLDNWKITGMLNKCIYVIKLALDVAQDPFVKSIISKSISDNFYASGINIVYDEVERKRLSKSIRYIPTSREHQDQQLHAEAELQVSKETKEYLQPMDTVYD